MRRFLHHSALWLILAFTVSAIIPACTYDDEETLYPDSYCDTVNVSYSGTIQPIFQSSCTVCHNDISLAGGYDFTTYDGVVASVNAGRLPGAINHETGFIPMPQGADKLSDCKITQITIWIGQGMPDN